MRIQRLQPGDRNHIAFELLDDDGQAIPVVGLRL